MRSLIIIVGAASVLIGPFLGARADLLKSQTFKVKGRLQILSSDNEVVHETNLIEYYSNADKRSLIELTSIDGQVSLRIYLTKDGQFVKFNPQTKECGIIDNKKYAHLLFGSLADLDLLDKWSGPIERVPDHYIGFTRLLAAIQKTQFERDGNAEALIIRGRPCHRFTSSVSWFAGLDTTINAFYTKDSYSPGKQGLHPIRVTVESSTNRSLLAVDFYVIEPVRPTPFQGLEYYVEPTTLPLGACALAFEGLKKQLYRPGSLRKFTLEADIIDHEHSRSKKALFVAYDSELSALRRDILIRSVSQLDYGGGDYSKTIYELKNGLRYNTKYKLRTVSSEGKSDSRILFRVDDMDTADCTVADIHSPSLDAPIPFERFALVGAGLVRGLNVDIYMDTAAFLPAMFFTQRLYYDETEWIHEGVGGKEFTIVYYFSTKDLTDRQNSSTLLRMDIFMDERLVKQIDIFNQIWRLSEAPNGDKPRELFSIHHSCTPRFDTKEASQMEAETVIDLTMKLDYEADKKLTGQRAMSLLDSTPFRNDAILRGFSRASPTLSATQIGELRSFIRRPDKSEPEVDFSILVSARLHLMNANAFKPTMVSYGSIHSVYRPEEDIDNFEECFNEACRRRKTDHVLFAFTEAGVCYIDDQPIFELKNDADLMKGASPSFTYSNIFRLEPKESPIRVMQVDFIERDWTKKSRRQTWMEIEKELLSSSFLLPLDEPTTVDGSEFVALLCRVTNMELHEERSTLAGSYAPLEGVGLDSGHLISEAGATMDTNACRVACLGDLECQSYSTCVRDSQLECVLSSVDFRDDNLVAKVRAQQTQTASASGKDKTLRFDLEISNEELDQRVVKLKLDRKCRIHKKRPIDMFIPKYKMGVALNQEIFIQVDSIQDCANRCLHMNLEFRKKVLASGSNQAEIGNAPAKHEQDSKKWCEMFKFFDVDGSTIGANLKRTYAFSKAGLCVLPRESASIPKAQADASNDEAVLDTSLIVSMDVLEFAYINLYKAHAGVRMLAVWQEDELTNGKQNRAENFQSQQVMPSLESCAKACFMQTSSLKPGCKSFGYVNLNDDSEPMSTLCHFNSMSLSEAEQMGVYDELVETDQHNSIVHYEPHAAFFMNSSILKQDYEGGPVPKSRTSHSSLRSNFALMLVIIVGSASGLMLSVKLKGLLVSMWLENRSFEARRLSVNSLNL